MLDIDELLHTDDPISKGYRTDKTHLRQRYTLIIETLFIKTLDFQAHVRAFGFRSGEKSYTIP